MVTAEQIHRFQLSIDELVAAVNRRGWTRTKRIRFVLFALVALLGMGLLWYLTLELPDKTRRTRAVAVVTQMHGHMGSLGPILPFWPFGKEYFITIEGIDLSPDDLQQLTVLNDLAGRHLVGVAFIDTNLKEQNLAGVRKVLPRCHVQIGSRSANQQRSRKDALP